MRRVSSSKGGKRKSKKSQEEQQEEAPQEQEEASQEQEEDREEENGEEKAGDTGSSGDGDNDSEDEGRKKKKKKKGGKKASGGDKKLKDKGKTSKKSAAKPPAPAAESEEEDEDYEVEAIVGMRYMRGKRQFRVRWQNYGQEHDSWCGEQELHCPDLVREFMQQQKDEEKSSKGKAGHKRKSGESSTKEDGDSDDEAEYEVQRVMDVKFRQNGKREFLIRWKGFGPENDTWEPEEHLNCTELINQLLARVDKAKEVTARELRTKPKQTDRLLFDNPQVRSSKRSKRGGRVMYHDLLE